MIDSTVTPDSPPVMQDACSADSGGCEKTAENIPDSIPAVSLPDAVTEQLARLRSIEHLGYLLQSKGREVAKAETAVAEATAARKGAMDFHNKKLREQQEIIDELTKLSTGKSTERLFPPQADKPAADAEPDEAWRSVDLATLTPKISPSKLKVLREHEPPIKTMGEWTDWVQKKGDWAVKDIKGLGAKGGEQIALACENYWAEHPQKAAEPPPAVSADQQFDDTAVNLETREDIIVSPGRYAIEIVRRNGGQWAIGYGATIGKKTLDSTGWEGSFTDRASAIKASAEKVWEFADGFIKNPKTSKKHRDQAKEIAAAIDALDKKLAGDALPSPEAQAASDVAITRKAAKDEPDPTPRDENGEPLRFKGNKAS